MISQCSIFLWYYLCYTKCSNLKGLYKIRVDHKTAMLYVVLVMSILLFGGYIFDVSTWKKLCNLLYRSNINNERRMIALGVERFPTLFQSGYNMYNPKYVSRASIKYFLLLYTSTLRVSPRFRWKMPPW